MTEQDRRFSWKSNLREFRHRPKTQNLHTPAKRRMKALSDSLSAHADRAGLILLFDGEVGPARRDLDEHSQTVILTWGLNLAPAFPAR